MLDEPVIAGGYEWATYAVTERLTGVPRGTLLQWVHRGHIEVRYTSDGAMLRLDQAQERERLRRTDPRHLHKLTELSDPLAIVPDAPTLPC